MSSKSKKTTKKGGSKKKKPSKKGSGALNNALEAVGLIRQSGLVGNLAGLALGQEAKTTATQLGFGSSKTKKGGRFYQPRVGTLPGPEQVNRIRLMPYQQDDVPLGAGRVVKKGGRKKVIKGNGIGDILGNVVNLPLAAAAGATLGLSAGLRSGINSFF